MTRCEVDVLLVVRFDGAGSTAASIQAELEEASKWWARVTIRQALRVLLKLKMVRCEGSDGARKYWRVK